ncbi:hypothetical protein ACP4OV_017579 [Aristida adscensionis]
MGDASSGGAGERQPASGLLRVVWFRQMLQRWQSSSTSAAAAAGRPSSGPGDNGEPAGGGEDRGSWRPAGERRRLPRLVAAVEEAGGAPATPDAPRDVPRGCCAVYVGAERRRFVVPTAYLGMPVFRRLLEKAEEEFGFDYHGAGITIPCDTEAFKWILVVMDRHAQGLVDDEGNPKEPGESPETR